MTLLFGDESAWPIAKAKPVSSSFYSLLVHAAVIGLLLAISFSTSVLKLPENLHATMLVAPAPPLAPPPAAVAVAATRAVRRAPSKFAFPTSVPVVKLPSSEELAIAEAPPAFDLEGGPSGVPGGVLGGVPGGVIGGVVGGLRPPPLPPAPAPVAVVVKPPEAPPVRQRVQVSGEVQEAKLLQMIHPVYPKLALTARIQGEVRVAAVIDKDGKIVELKVIEGNPFLVDAALDSIKKWRYRPTFLSGEPVEVATQIIVHFRLNQ